MNFTRYECTVKGHNKCWEHGVEENWQHGIGETIEFKTYRVVTRYGPIGKTLSRNIKVFPSLGDAVVFISDKVNEKLKKGYVKVSGTDAIKTPPKIPANLSRLRRLV